MPEQVSRTETWTGTDAASLVNGVLAPVRQRICELERIEAAAREAVEALNSYESTIGATYANEQRVHVLDALRRLREVLDA